MAFLGAARSCLCALGLGVVATAQSSFVANVKNYGAVGDGLTMDTPAFVSALADVAAHNGGTLYVPPGTFLMAPINLTNNLVLQLDGATLLASARVRAVCEFMDWDIIAPLPNYGRGRDFPGPRFTSLLHGYNLTNVRITSNSSGVIEGQGSNWWSCIVNKTLSLTPGHLIEFLWSSNIEIDHLTMRNSPFWFTHIWSSTNFHFHDMTVIAPIHSTNTDGVTPDATSNVLIENFNASTGDDCVSIKAGWIAAYTVPTRNVTVRNMTCTTQSACIAVGSEMSGGVADVSVKGLNCLTAGQGLNVKSALGRGGFVTNVSFEDVVMTTVGTALAAVTDYRDQYPPFPVNASLIPLFALIRVRNVTAGPGAVIGTVGDFLGLGPTAATGQILGVDIQDVHLAGAKSGWHCANVTGTSANVQPAPCKELTA